MRLLGRTRFVAVAVAGALLTAGCIEFEVTKKTTGGTSSGPFVVTVSCKTDSTTTSQELTFNGEDTKTADFTLPDGATCTITETESAGATSTTLECVSVTPNNKGVTCTEKDDSLEVLVPNDLEPVIDDVTVAVKVTNDFTPPPTPPPSTETPTTAAAPTTAAPPAAPPPVEAAPVFTG